MVFVLVSSSQIPMKNKKKQKEYVPFQANPKGECMYTRSYFKQRQQQQYELWT